MTHKRETAAGVDTSAAAHTNQTKPHADFIPGTGSDATYRRHTTINPAMLTRGDCDCVICGETLYSWNPPGRAIVITHTNKLLPLCAAYAICIPCKSKHRKAVQQLRDFAHKDAAEAFAEFGAILPPELMGVAT